MGPLHRIIALWLVCSSVALATPNVPREHVVQPGQTLAKIAKRYRVELDDLCQANDLKKSAKLQPGTRLTLPTDDDRDPTARPSAARENHGASATKRAEPERRASARATSYSQYAIKPTRRGWVHVMGHRGEWQGQLLAKNGKLQPKSAIALSRLLAWPRTDFQMDRRLLLLLAQVSDAFGGRTLRVVSGYRATSYASESKHPQGRACDFHVLGVPNTALRDFVRTFDNVGVGYYPNSTFVHLDVREYDAYWVDYAGPGEPPRSTPYRVSRATVDGSITPARAAAVVKSADSGVDSSTVDPEAAADLQSHQQEQRTQQDPPATAPDPAKSRPFGPHSNRRDMPQSGIAREPESTPVPAALPQAPPTDPDSF